MARKGVETGPGIRPISRDEKRTLARMEGKLRGELAKGEALAHRIGSTFDAIARSQLYRHAFPTLRAYAEATFAQGYTTLWRYRRVAVRFSAREVKLHGTNKLSLGLDYIALTPEQERPRELFSLGIRVPAGKGVRVVAFRDAQVQEIKAAIDRLENPRAAEKTDDARAVKKRAALQSLLDPPKGSKRHAPKARAYETDDDTIRYDVVGVDEDDLDRVGRALIALGRTRKTAR
jgi:hypothetical protein